MATVCSLDLYTKTDTVQLRSLSFGMLFATKSRLRAKSSKRWTTPQHYIRWYRRQYDAVSPIPANRMHVTPLYCLSINLNRVRMRVFFFVRARASYILLLKNV